MHSLAVQRIHSAVLGPVLAALIMGAAPGLELDGNFVQGGLALGRVLPGSEVEFDGAAVRVSDDGNFVIGFGRDEGAKVDITVRHPDGRIEKQSIAVKSRQYDIQRIDGLPPKKVTPPPETMARIRKEIRLVKNARARDLARTDFLAGFRWPARGRISGVYGSQRVLNGEPRRPHFGVDIAAPVGTPVRAPAPGLVTLAQPDLYFSGGTIIIDHGHGLSSSFLHLSALAVKVGDVVTTDTVIGEIGATGRATGPHLDWRMNFKERRLDPQLLVGAPPSLDNDQK
ncbi:MAG: M23 family metallopeptidase [Gammaproteobacteria bacterium]|nr:M23 family metallopeptidase [Gammaproteobacteria bacterium]